MNNTDEKTLILTAILNCGYADIDFIISELKEYQIEIFDIDWQEKSCNEVLESIYMKAVSNINIHHNLWINKISTYTNFLDSHLYFNNEEIFNYDELKKTIAKYLWDLLGDVPIKDNDEVDTPFLDFEKGANREEIWAWFEETFNLSVVEDLMYK